MNLQRNISAGQLWAITVGMVISGQYFGWNYGYSVGGLWGLIIAAIIVTIFYFCFIFLYTELAISIPSAGGPSAYAHRAFGPLVGYMAGIACLIEFVFAPPAIAVSIGSYLHFLFPFLNTHIAAIGAFVFCVFLNLSGTRNVAVFETVVTIIALGGLIIYYSAGLPHVKFSRLVPTQHFLPFGVHGIFAAIPFAIWLYLCVEGGAMAAEEIKNPHLDIAKGLISAIITLALCSFFTIFITAGLEIKSHELMDYPLPNALSHLYKQTTLPLLVDIFGLFGLFASLNGVIIGYSRQTYYLSRKGYFPSFLCQLSKRHVPHWALIIPGLFGIVFAGSATVSNSLIIMAVFAAVSMYCISIISLFKLRIKEPNLQRPFKVFYPIVPIIALLLGLVCFMSVLYFAILPNNLELFTYNVPLIVILFILVIFSLLFYFLKKYKYVNSSELRKVLVKDARNTDQFTHAVPHMREHSTKYLLKESPE